MPQLLYQRRSICRFCNSVYQSDIFPFGMPKATSTAESIGQLVLKLGAIVVFVTLSLGVFAYFFEMFGLSTTSSYFLAWIIALGIGPKFLFRDC